MTNKTLSKFDIKQNIWTFNQKMSEPDNPIYTHTFPIKRYGKSVILLGEFIKNKSGKITVNVYNNSTGESCILLIITMNMAIISRLFQR